MADTMWSALTELAGQVAVYVERAPGLTEKRLVLLRGFAEAHGSIMPSRMILTWPS